MFKEIKYRNNFIKDRDDRTRAIWLNNSSDARKFMSNDFSPLEKDGLVDTGDIDNPVLKISSIPEKIRFLKGRIFYNPLEPEVAPHEDEQLEEAVRMTAKSIFRHEMRDERGPHELNLLEEIDEVVNDALVDGYGVSDHRVDTTIRDELFYKGKPLHIRRDPQDVVFDRRAQKSKKVQRIHLINRWTEEEYKARWPKIDLANIDKEFRDIDGETREDLFCSIETQERRENLRKRRVLPPEFAKDLGINSMIIDEQDLKNYISELKAINPSDYEYLNNEIIKEFPQVEVLDWGVDSTMWSPGVDKPLSKKLDLGKRFSIEVLGFFPVIGHPYYNGVPFFLRSPQAMEIIGNTILTRIVMRADRSGGEYDQDALSPEQLEQLKKNKIGDWVGLRVFEGRIEDKLKRREVSPYLQYIQAYLGHVGNLMNSAFGTQPEQRGEAAFAGQSGKLGQLLISSGAYMFFHFVGEIDKYLKRVFSRVLHLAVDSIPKSTQIIIAGEQFPDRVEIIQSGLFAQRIENVNVDVRLDTTTEGERNYLRQIIGNLLMKQAFPPESGYRYLGMKEPARVAGELEEYQAQRSRAMMFAQIEKKHPDLMNSINNMIKDFMQTYQKLTEGNTLKS